MCMYEKERGATLIEFAFAFIIFSTFLFGFIGITMWGIGGHFVQDAAHEAVRKYSVTLDRQSAENVATSILGKWAYIFIEPDTVVIQLRHDTEKAYGTVTAVPKIKRLYLFNMPELRRESSCTLEYRFRNPGEYST